MNKSMVTMWKSERLCPACDVKMNTDGKSWFCPACGLEIQKKKPKKWAYRTARNIREDEQ
jgi:tRNA(Ile2) C34 agmatinyltransferase TiaS